MSDETTAPADTAPETPAAEQPSISDIDRALADGKDVEIKPDGTATISEPGSLADGSSLEPVKLPMVPDPADRDTVLATPEELLAKAEADAKALAEKEAEEQRVIEKAEAEARESLTDELEDLGMSRAEAEAEVAGIQGKLSAMSPNDVQAIVDAVEERKRVLEQGGHPAVVPETKRYRTISGIRVGELHVPPNSIVRFTEGEARSYLESEAIEPAE